MASERDVAFEGSVSGDAGVPTVFLARSPRTEAPLPRLFIGVLSDYHRAHADDAELSSTLAVREVPLWVQRGRAEQTLMPLEALLPRSQYTLVTNPGRSIEILTRRAQPRLERVWPKLVSAAMANGDGIQRAVYCVATAPQAEANFTDLSLLDVGATSTHANGDSAAANDAPSPRPDRVWPNELGTEFSLLCGGQARWAPLQGRPGCAVLSVEAALPPQGDITPPRIDGVLAAPVVFTPSGHATELSPAPCPNTAALSPGCAVVHDDRMLISYDATPALWCFGGDLSGCVATEPGTGALVRGLTSQTRYAVDLVVTRADGVVWSSAPEIETAEQRAHVVINEVLSNPNGAEPQQEWVELYNDGAGSVELEGWQLADSAGVVVLPRGALAAGDYALLVNEGFMPNTELDVAPPPSVKLVSLPRVASGGLSNSGEALRLMTPDGRVASSWPVMRGESGVSLARREPSAGTAAGVDITLHAEPGASPGLPNLVQSQ